MNKEFVVAELKKIASAISRAEKKASKEGSEMRKQLEEVESFTRRALWKVKKMPALLDKISKDEHALHYSEEFDYELKGILHEAKLLVKELETCIDKNNKMG